MGWQHVLAALVLSHVAVAAWAREAGTGARTAASAWRDATDALLVEAAPEAARLVAGPTRRVSEQVDGRMAKEEADQRMQSAREQALQERQAREASRRKSVSLPLGRAPVSVVPVRAGAEFWEDAQEGRWEPETFKAIYQEVTADVAYLGVGEWCGVTGLMAAQRASRAVLVEPDPLALEELQTNVNIYNAEARSRRVKIDNRWEFILSVVCLLSVHAHLTFMVPV